MAAKPPDAPKHWAVDWTINIGTVMALILQMAALLAAGGWYSAKVDARLFALETTDIRLTAERDIRRKATDDKFDVLYRDRDRLVRVETLLESFGRSLTRIESKLDREPQLRP
ncbi:MAG: hypothetical protein U1E62_05515 [Alsobacter sp.]